MFATDKIGETMTVAMRPADAKAWFGVPPPDLTVEARVRGADWLYNYFLAFYKDDTAPSGWNNLDLSERRDAARARASSAARTGSSRTEFKDHEEAQAAALAAKGIVVLGAGKDHTFVVQTLAVDTPGTLDPGRVPADGRRSRQLSRLHGRAHEEQADRASGSSCSCISACCSFSPTG